MKYEYVVGRWWFPKEGEPYFVTLFRFDAWSSALEILRTHDVLETGDVIRRYGAAELRTVELKEER